jgi:hypothetical protein
MTSGGVAASHDTANIAEEIKGGAALNSNPVPPRFLIGENSNGNDHKRVR